jgi:DNA-binding LacI/PurR family transcriptional regulator
MGRQVTLKQVASHAGVSYQTVSKVINHQVQVSKETEDRIWNSVRELGYRPNLIARSLRANRSYMIGYSWEPSPPDKENNILDQFIQSMATVAESAGYHMLAFPHRPGNEWISGYRELIDTNRVDGFVLYSVEFDDPRVKLLQEYHFPFVAFGRSKPGWDFPHVDVDGTAGMRMVIDHLLGQGYRRIAVLAWPEDSRVGQNRMEGITGGLQDAGVSLSPELLARGEGVFQFGLEATSHWLDLPSEQRPDAIVAFNDLMAVGAMRAIQDRGLQVGKDLAVTGFDDMPLAQYINPSLTSVRQPIWEVGQKVMSLLLDLLEEKQPEQDKILVDPVLIVRESSKAPR